jgi:hypothetical protein
VPNPRRPHNGAVKNLFRGFRSKEPNADPELSRTVLGAMREDGGLFAGINEARVLVYWPHGLGDWTHLSVIAPLLEPTNSYAVTRFGDDYVSLMEGNALLQPLWSGVRAPADGSALGAPHFGVDLRRCDGGKTHMALPPPLDDAIMMFAPEVLLWTDYPETEGRTAYPYHTKARNLARLLVAPQRLATLDLSQPLPSTIDFAAPGSTQAALDARLAQFAAPGSRVCVISRAGVTAARKNWGEGAEAAEFVRVMRERDPRWRFISMDGDDLGDGVAAYRTLFADIDEPFARAYKALAARTDLFVGVPAGPLHMTMARGGIPTIGLWLAHHPDWYDEPNPAAVHIIGRYVTDRRFDKRPATTTKPASLRHRIIQLDTLDVPATVVQDAAGMLL